ncbi:MAG: Na/Pi cotransporter family protein [Oscillospiraceae bacterium]|nr:Na/Pi cotransporter family protein [Oscillospiraceae bacterium]
MGLMSDGLKQLAGNKLEVVLYRLSNTPLKGILLGTAVTLVIQSSAATSVMVIGFVNSGMMKLAQAISIILGSIVGTSVTGWVVSLSTISGSGWLKLVSTATITGVVAIIGILLRMISKKTWKRSLGGILLGFAVLMYGISAMSTAVAPLKESRVFADVMTAFSNPVLGFLAGAAITAVLQSSSSAVGLLETLAGTGAITFGAALPLLMGIGVGASVPVLLASIGATKEAKRSAWSYLVISIGGAIAAGILWFVLTRLFTLTLNGRVMNAVSIALLNTVFRVLTAVALFPLIRQIEKLLEKLVRSGKEPPQRAYAPLEERFLANPVLALEQCRTAVMDMSAIVSDNLKLSMDLLVNYSEEGFRTVEQGENDADHYEDEIGTYLVKLTGSSLHQAESREAAKYLHAIGDLERMSDHSMNIAECAKEIMEKKIVFSEPAVKELKVITRAVTDIADIALWAFNTGSMEDALRVEPLEELIDDLCDELKLHHVNRIQNHQCTLENGFVFNDLLTNFERISDHCSNIAIAMIELRDGVLDAHAYLDDLKERKDESFRRHYEEYKEKYAIEA